jgi:putative flippase GtrA
VRFPPAPQLPERRGGFSTRGADVLGVPPDPDRLTTAVALPARTILGRAIQGLSGRHNWEQLLKFCAVGGSGYAVNLAVYTVLLNSGNLDYRAAATGSFLVAVTNNYTWNRAWTFRLQRGHIGYQGLRFLLVSVAVYAANLALLTFFVEAEFGEIVSQAAAIVLVTPLNFLGSKLWSFRGSRPA